MNQSIEELTLLITKNSSNPYLCFKWYLKRGQHYRAKGQLLEKDNFEHAKEQYAKSIKDYDFIINTCDTYNKNHHNNYTNNSSHLHCNEYSKNNCDISNIEAHYERGFSKYLLNNFKESVDEFEIVITLDPNYTKAYFTKAIIMEKLNDNKQAIADFNMVIRLNNKDKKAFYNRGLVYSKLNKHKEAIKDFNESIKIDPQYFQAYNSKGYSQFKLKQYDVASLNFKKALAINSDYFEAYLNYAIYLEKIEKNTTKAIEHLERAKRLDPERYNRENTEDKNKQIHNIENFQKIFSELEQGFEDSECIWLIFSILITCGTGYIFYHILLNYSEYKNLYFIYLFSSIITGVVIRQYTNAKNLRIESQNRLAMAKLFEYAQKNKTEKYQQFIKPLINSLVYSMRENKNQESANNQELNIHSKLPDLLP